MSESNINASSKPATSTLRLDSEGRRTIEARNQQQMLKSIGLIKSSSSSNDNFTLSPLKGLLSAAGSSYVDMLKKSSSRSSTLGKATGSYGKADEIRKAIDAENEAKAAELAALEAKKNASASGSGSTSSGSGGSSSGSGTVKDVDTVTTVENSNASESAKRRLNAILETLEQSNVKVDENEDGSLSFYQGDFKGTIRLSGNDVIGKTDAIGGTVRFLTNESRNDRIAKSGTQDANEAIAAKRVQALLDGDADALRNSLESDTYIGGTAAAPTEPEPAAAQAQSEEPETIDPARLTSTRGINFSNFESNSDLYKAILTEVDDAQKLLGYTGTLSADKKTYTATNALLGSVKGTVNGGDNKLTFDVTSLGKSYQVKISADGSVNVSGDTLGRAAIETAFTTYVTKARARIAPLNLVA